MVALIVPTVLCGSLGFMGSLENEDGEDLYPWAGKFFSTYLLHPMILYEFMISFFIILEFRNVGGSFVCSCSRCDDVLFTLI